MTIDSSNSRMMSGVRELVGAEVLVIDKDEKVQRGITQLLSAASLHVTCESGPDKAFEVLERKFFSVVVIDLDTPIPNAGIDTIRSVKQRSPTSMVVALTPRKSYGDVVESIRAGAIDIVLKAQESVQYLKDRIVEAVGRSVDKREVNSVLADVRDVQDEFLTLFMAAERRALDLSDRAAGRASTKTPGEEIRILIVDSNDALQRALSEKAPDGYVFDSALAGGQALDMASSSRYHLVLVSDQLPDLPGSMVVRSVKTQNPELVALAFSGPGPGGTLEIVETTKTIKVVDEFTTPKQLLERLDELAEAFHARSRERRYTQAFRERHFDFLRRYVELKSKIDRALTEG